MLLKLINKSSVCSPADLSTHRPFSIFHHLSVRPQDVSANTRDAFMAATMTTLHTVYSP